MGGLRSGAWICFGWMRLRGYPGVGGEVESRYIQYS
jgi:hypothetical protein